MSVDAFPQEADREERNVLGAFPLHLALILLVALVARLLHLGDSPWHDEFFHILAARSWLADGTLHLVEGGAEYTRTTLYTYLVAGVIWLFGESLEIARLPAVFFGTLWVGAIFTWTWWAAGRLAAWIAGAWFALEPGAIVMSQFVRFYALHGLLFFLLAVAVYYLVTRRPGLHRFALLVLGAVGCFLLAAYFQLTTLVGTVALGIWVALVMTPGVVAWLRDAPRARTVVAGAGSVLLAAGVLWMLRHDLAAAWTSYRSAAVWAQDQADNVFYYFDWFAYRYPTFWALFPVALVAAVARRPVLGLFCAVMFVVPFVLHSFAAFKAERFLYYAIPFFVVTWALVLADFLPWLARRAEVLASRAWSTLGLGSSGASVVRYGTIGAVAIVVLGFLAYNNPVAVMSFRTLAPKDTRPYAQPNWGEVAPQLSDLARESDVLVTSSYMKTLYYVGDFDVSLQRGSVEEGRAPEPVEFGPERLTARPSVSTPESVRTIHQCFERGLVVVDWGHWRHDYRVPPETSDYLEEHMEPVDLPSEPRLRVFRWRTNGTAGDAECPAELMAVRNRAAVRDV